MGVLKTIVLIVVLFPQSLSAGIVGYGSMNSAMISHEDYSSNFIPDFDDDISAMEFGHNTKWDESILRAFEIRRREIENYWLKVDLPGPRRQYFLFQKRRIELAVEIMEQYKKRGEKGDRAQVGSSTYIGEMPWKRK